MAGVSRARVERLARRHHLVVTASNGNQLIRYLATTRRWRAAGLAAGLAISIGAGLAERQLRLSAAPLLAGWFAGALVAELRVQHLGFDTRRRASLVPREAGRYLPRWHLWLLPATAIACLLAGLASLAIGPRPAGTSGPTGTSGPAGPVIALLAVGFGLACGAWLAQRWVLRRPQPLADPDQLAADDAIRSRSLHVLTAAGAVLVSFCALGQAQLLLAAHARPSLDLAWLPLLGYPVVALLGWLAATSAWSVAPQPGHAFVPVTATATATGADQS